jgi:hypothetical protein
LHEHQLTGLDVKKIYHGFLELLTCSLSNRGGNGHNIGDVMMMSGPNVFRKLEDIKKSLRAGALSNCYIAILLRVETHPHFPHGLCGSVTEVGKLPSKPNYPYKLHPIVLAICSELW